jgi:hypothetical protein
VVTRPAEFTGFRVEVGKIDSDGLRATKASTVEDGEDCCVPGAGRSRILSAGDEEGP